MIEFICIFGALLIFPGIIFAQWVEVAQTETKRRKALERENEALKASLKASRELYRHACEENKFLKIAVNA